MAVNDATQSFPIELKAWLQDGKFYIIGQQAICYITLTNKSTFQQYHSNADATQECAPRLAWMSGQIYLQCIVKESLVHRPKTRKPTDPNSLSPSTSFIPFYGERGYSIRSSASTVLLCDHTLEPNQPKTIIYKEKIPCGPPSFPGTLVRFSYKLVIGAQMVNGKVKLLRIPLQVIAAPPRLEVSSASIPSALQYAPDGMSNPFIDATTEQSVRNERRFIEKAREMFLDEASQRTTRSYNLKHDDDRHICTVCLFKPIYATGDEIIVSLDFSLNDNLKAYKTIVSLETLEKVKEDYRVEGNPTYPSTYQITTEQTAKSQDTFYLRETHMTLSIPLEATPTFHTDMVTLSWQLKFIFLTTEDKKGMLIQHDGFQLANENMSGLQIIEWILPIVVIGNYPGPMLLDYSSPCEITKL